MIEEKERSYILGAAGEWDNRQEGPTFKEAIWRMTFEPVGPDRKKWTHYAGTLYGLVEKMKELNDKRKGD